MGRNKRGTIKKGTNRLGRPPGRWRVFIWKNRSFIAQNKVHELPSDISGSTVPGTEQGFSLDVRAAVGVCVGGSVAKESGSLFAGPSDGQIQRANQELKYELARFEEDSQQGNRTEPATVIPDGGSGEAHELWLDDFFDVWSFFDDS